MATSGTYTFNLNTQQVIKDALIEAGVIRDDQEVDGGMYDSARRRLNRILKALQAQGLHLWRTTDCTLILEDGKREYTLGPSGDKWTETLVNTTLSAAEALGQTILSVTSSAGMTAADIVGIELDSGTIDWTTIASVDSTTQITVDVATTGVAASGNRVYAYTALAPKPLKIHSAYIIRAGNETNSTPLNIIPMDEYFQRNDKTTESYPNDVFFRPLLTTAEVKIWPLSADNTSYIVMMAELPLDDVTITTDDLSVPNWWYEAIHYKMSAALALSYGSPIDRVRILEAKSMTTTEEAKNFSAEDTYVQITPEYYLGYHYD